MSTTHPSPPRAAAGRGARRPAWLVVAAAEFRLLLRNRTALVMATVMPVAMGLVIVYISRQNGPDGPSAEVAAMQLIMLLGFTGYATATMMLAARRAQLWLKRLRGSPAPAAGILTGLVAPLLALLAVQAGLLFAATSVAWGEPPTRPALLVLAVLIGGATCVAMAFLTAAYTRTAESAQLTTLPGFLILVAGLLWVVTTPPEQVSAVHLAVPGAAVAHLTRYGWDTPLPESGGLLAAAGPALGISLAVAAAVAYLAVRVFKWEPRG